MQGTASMGAACRRPMLAGAACRAASVLAVAGALGACASAVQSPPAPAPAPAPAPTPQLPAVSTGVAWMWQSAEYPALTEQTYRAAASRLDQLVPAMSGAAWGVILDADETMLDNTAYAIRREALDSAYTEASWAVWVHEEAATAVPGAVDFTRHVHALGGRVVIVTNRADSLCAPTRTNLQRLGLETDLVLCQPGAQADKNPRFEAVERGTASPALPPLTVVEWLGDNIQDFPMLQQASRNDPSAMALFGRRYFVLPNPVYGSWPTRLTRLTR